MKNIKLLALIIAIILVISCKKDDSVNIIGKWHFQFASKTIYQNGIQESHTENSAFTIDDYYEFEENGTLSLHTRAGYVGTNKYIIQSGKLLITQTGVDGADEFDIKKLTLDKLELFKDETKNFGGIPRRFIEERTFGKR